MITAGTVRRDRPGLRAGACAGLVVALILSIIRVAESASQAAPSMPSTSAWDGAFNQEQVERGKTAYDAQCARCHGETLGGGENSPALVDEMFFAIWNGKAVGELVERIRTTMPSDGPGVISRKRSTDLAAYLLRANGFPAGDHELPGELDALNQIMITRTR
jgi:mono/diheme cytochrome c family protein